MNIVMIGSGNVAWHLAPALENKGHKIVGVYSPNASNASALTKRLHGARLIDSLDFSEIAAAMFVIAVDDRAIEEVAKRLILPDKAIVVHTSGSQPLDVLKHIPTEHVGVFYPLQSFSKAKNIDFTNIPLLIESEDSFTKKALMKVASQLSKKVLHVQSKDRKALHVSAVFACNFTNHLFTIAEKLLKEKQLDFNLLKPLISETLNKCLEIGPQNAQTGPAARRDLETIENHIKYLGNNSNYVNIYKMITESVMFEV